MGDLAAYFWVALGVVVAVIFPVLAAYIRKEFVAEAGPAIPPWIKRYLALLVFSFIVALISLAIWKKGNPNAELDRYTAFLIGFGWESALEKFFRPI